MSMDWVIFLVEGLLKLWFVASARRGELLCMPVVDAVKEYEEQVYCNEDRSREIETFTTSHQFSDWMPICRPVARLIWAKERLGLVEEALDRGFVQGSVVRRADGRSVLLLLMLTSGGRRAWSRYCTVRRMRWRSKVFHNGEVATAAAHHRRRDSRTRWSVLPPEAPLRGEARLQARTTYG